MDDGTTKDVAFEDLVQLVSSPTMNESDPLSDPFHGLPNFLHRNSKITMDHHGAYQKGFLQHTNEGGFRFEVRRNARSAKVESSVPLPDFRKKLDHPRRGRCHSPRPR